MKNVSQGTQHVDSLNQLDHAIDARDIHEVEKQLAILSDWMPLPCTVEDSQLFAKKIIDKHKKGNENMKKSKRKLVALVASFALVLCMGITVYASGIYKQFTFFNDDTTVIVKSDQDMSEEEAKRIADEAADNYNQPVDEEENVVPVGVKSYTSIKAIEEALGIDVIVPTYIPEEFVMDQEIHTEAVADSTVNIYVTYTSKVDSESLFGITIRKEDLPEGSTSVTVVDSVYKDTYTTPTGIKYNILTEESAIIACTEINDIQYGLIFVGVSDAEMYKVIDSTDLAGYLK